MNKLIKFVMYCAENICTLHLQIPIDLLPMVNMITNTIKLIPRYKGYNVVTKSLSHVLDYGEDAVELGFFLTGNMGGLA